MPDVVADLPSYHDRGRDDITADRMRERFDRFVADALANGPIPVAAEEERRAAAR
jgi:hypothetical protein